MSKFRKTTATLLIAIFMISTFAVLIPVSADLVYSYSTTIPIDGSTSPLVLTVVVDDDWVTWTFDFPVEVFTGDGNLNVGLIIALDGEGEGPAFQIHNNDGTDNNFDWGTWLWSPYYDGSWHSGDENTLVTALDWVEASGNRNVPHGDGVMTVSISRAVLGNEFHWAASPTVGSGFWYAYDVTMQVPSAFGWSNEIVDMNEPNYMFAQIIPPKSEFVPGQGKGLDKPVPNDNFAKGRQE